MALIGIMVTGPNAPIVMKFENVIEAKMFDLGIHTFATAEELANYKLFSDKTMRWIAQRDLPRSNCARIIFQEANLPMSREKFAKKKEIEVAMKKIGAIKDGYDTDNRISSDELEITSAKAEDVVRNPDLYRFFPTERVLKGGNPWPKAEGVRRKYLQLLIDHHPLTMEEFISLGGYDMGMVQAVKLGHAIAVLKDEELKG